MINSKNSLQFYLAADLKRFENGKPGLKDFILRNEVWYIYKYQFYLRKYEYYLNTGVNYILKNYYLVKLKRLGFKLHITIYPNTIGPGLRIYHIGDFIHIKKNCRIGANVTLQPGVVIGNKYLYDDDSFVAVGNDCYFGLGSKIFGNVIIGNNVVIGANVIVTRNVPDNSLVRNSKVEIVNLS